MSKTQTGGATSGGNKGATNNNGSGGKEGSGLPSKNKGMPSGGGRVNNPPGKKR